MSALFPFRGSFRSEQPWGQLDEKITRPHGRVWKPMDWPRVKSMQTHANVLHSDPKCKQSQLQNPVEQISTVLAGLSHQLRAASGASRSRTKIAEYPFALINSDKL